MQSSVTKDLLMIVTFLVCAFLAFFSMDMATQAQAGRLVFAFWILPAYALIFMTVYVRHSGWFGGKSEKKEFFPYLSHLPLWSYGLICGVLSGLLGLVWYQK